MRRTCHRAKAVNTVQWSYASSGNNYLQLRSNSAYVITFRRKIYRNALLIRRLKFALSQYTPYYRCCSDSFLSISLSLVNGYYTISLLFPINSHLSTRVKILFQSSLLIESSLPDNRYKLFATVRSFIKVSLYFFYIYVVYLLYVLLVQFSFSVFLAISSFSVSLMLHFATHFSQFCICCIFFQFEPHATSTTTLIKQINVLALSSKISKDYCARSNCPLSYLGNLLRLQP